MAEFRSFNLSSSDVSQPKNAVRESFFGANMLFDRDRVGEAGTFDEKAAALSVDFIRYPGGAIAEESFLLSDPNRTSDAANGRSSLMPLDEFISYVGDVGGEYALVVPTKTYMEALRTGAMSPNEIRAQIREFSERLKAGEFGDQLPKIIEIGNEYYTFEGVSNAVEADLYGRVAKMFSQEIKKVFQNDLDIAVQAGIDAASNEIILDYFDRDGYLVDQVIFHSYPWTIDEAWRFEGLKMDIADAWLDAGVAEGVFASEYNISNQHADGAGRVLDIEKLETGMAKAVALVEMAAGLIENDVDYAAVWPLQQRSNGDLGGDEGEVGGTSGKLSTKGLTLSGEAFRLLSESVVGKTLVKSERLDFDNANESERYEKEAFIRVFESRDETTIFLSGWDLQAHQIGQAIDFNLPGKYFGGDVVRLYSAAAFDNPNGRPVLEQTILDEAAAENLSVSLEHDYEVVRITLNKVGRYEAGTAGADVFMGAGKNDSLVGDGGDDMIDGKKGADTLEGGVGSDSLYGGDGSDELHGQQNDDHLFGGKGNDTLLGGNGDDHLVGGMGHDRLGGAAGHDTIEGDIGRDTLMGRDGADELYGGANDDRLFTGKGNDIADGGDGRDELISYYGHDTLIGGADSDTFHFAAKGGARTITIEDFEVGVDRLVFEGDAPTEADITIQPGADAFVFADNVKVVLKGVGDIDLSDIGLVRKAHVRKADDARLTVGVVSDEVIGNRYKGETDADAFGKVSFENAGRDLTFEFTSFDIDFSTEMEVLLNGKLLGALDAVGNAATGFHSFALLEADLLPGENEISFVQKLGPSATWGVEDFLLS